jgi:hypothetical protein
VVMLVYDDPRTGLGRVPETITPDSGAFHFDGLVEGSYKLIWQARGEMKVNRLVQRFSLERDEHVRRTLRPTGHSVVRGTIDFEGRIPAHVRVYLTPTSSIDAWGLYHGVLAQDGSFRFGDVAAGTYVVEVAFLTPGTETLVRGSSEVVAIESRTVDTRVEVTLPR